MSALVRAAHGVVLGADGSPQPPTEIVRRLRQIDDRFRLHPAPDGRAVWWVVRVWGEDDPRRAMIRRQEVSADDAYDLFCEIPRDCPVWEVPNFLMRRLERTTKPELRRMVDDLARYNADVKTATLDRAMEEPRNRLELGKQRLFNLGRVASAGIPGAPNGPAVKRKG